VATLRLQAARSGYIIGHLYALDGYELLRSKHIVKFLGYTYRPLKCKKNQSMLAMVTFTR